MSFSDKLHLRDDILLSSTINITPSKDFSFCNLKKIIAYAKRKQNYPTITYEFWNSMLCSKLLLKSPIARLFFECYCTVLNMDCSTDTKMNINILLLLIHLNTVRRVDSVILSNCVFQENAETDIWHANIKLAKEITFISNILSALGDIFYLIDPESSETGFVSKDAMKYLDVLFEGYENKQVLKFSEFLFLKVKCVNNSFLLKDVAHLIKHSLEKNPFSIAKCSCSGELVQFQKKKVFFRPKQVKSSHALTNFNCAPVGRQVFSFVKLTKQALALSSKIFENASIHISNCKETTLYILSPLKMVTIENCNNCTFVLGSVTQTVSISYCNNIAVHTVACRVVIEKCVESKFYILTICMPVIIGPTDTKSIKLAPFNTYYLELPTHMEKCGSMKWKINNWNDPICILNELYLYNPSPDLLLPISQFWILNLSLCNNVSLENVYSKIPGLPKEYLKHICETFHAINELKDVKDTFEQNTDSELIRKFNAWIVKEGHHRELSLWNKKC